MRWVCVRQRERERERERLVDREGLIERKKWEDKESVCVFLESKVWRVCLSERETDRQIERV